MSRLPLLTPARHDALLAVVALALLVVSRYDMPRHRNYAIDHRLSDDLMEATKKAVRHMINHLHDEHGLSRGEAYVLCSAAVDLKISEVVDAPNWTVSAYLPESIFP